MQSIRLLSGYDMPLVGLGTWQSQPEEIERAVLAALETGYRLIDTAFSYNNEEAIGRSLKKWFEKGGKREELFITTKLPHFGNTPNEVEKYIKMSLERLQLDYLDMYLIHAPFATTLEPNTFIPAKEPDGSYKLQLNTSPVSVWKEMEKQVRNGNTRSIGLSNFSEKQITEVWESAKIKPSNFLAADHCLSQVELHAFHQQKPLRQLCRKYGIAVTSYSSLASPAAKGVIQKVYEYDLNNSPNLLGHPIVKEIAISHSKTPAQVLLHHLAKQGIIVIPKSANPQRIKENFQLFDFELTEEERNQLDALDRGNRGRIFDFTFFKGITKHPQYPFKDELNQ